MRCENCDKELKETDFYKKDLVNKAFRNQKLICKKCKGLIAKKKWYSVPENRKKILEYEKNYAKTDKGKEVRRRANRKYLKKKREEKNVLQRETEIDEID